MARKWIRKYLPSPAALRGQAALGPIRHLLSEPELWHLHRRAVSGACFIGLFVAFLPLPVGQMVVAALLAIVARCNLPIAVSLVWITNPITVGPMFFFAYKLGCWLLDVQVQNTGWELSWEWLREKFAAVWKPLLVGSLVCGWVSGLTAAVVSRVLWRLHVVRRWQARRERRRLKLRGRRVGGASGAGLSADAGERLES